MAKYGPNRTYKVDEIRWDMSPQNYYFEQSEQKASKISMLEYFLRVYNLKITQTNQPLFEIKQKR